MTSNTSNTVDTTFEQGKAYELAIAAMSPPCRAGVSVNLRILGRVTCKLARVELTESTPHKISFVWDILAERGPNSYRWETKTQATVKSYDANPEHYMSDPRAPRLPGSGIVKDLINLAVASFGYGVFCSRKNCYAESNNSYEAYLEAREKAPKIWTLEEVQSMRDTVHYADFEYPEWEIQG